MEGIYIFRVGVEFVPSSANDLLFLLSQFDFSV